LGGWTLGRLARLAAAPVLTHGDHPLAGETFSSFLTIRGEAQHEGQQPDRRRCIRSSHGPVPPRLRPADRPLTVELASTLRAVGAGGRLRRGARPIARHDVRRWGHRRRIRQPADQHRDDQQDQDWGQQHPPTITVASGRCVWAPMPVEMAAGTSPMQADRQVISTGRMRTSADCCPISSVRAAGWAGQLPRSRWGW
jgi:hypothetical protein